ncbi:MAG: hypothetical protein GDA48_26780 [Hormoscilla sp. GM102CHS1]|nr:hypothetical protein [Hormoscilla sp. GM102CHS1]
MVRSRSVRAAQSRLLANWEQNPEIKPLQNICDRLFEPKPRNIQLLKLYQ